eukprot:scpid12249/ scgid9263/ 
MFAIRSTQCVKAKADRKKQKKWKHSSMRRSGHGCFFHYSQPMRLFRTTNVVTFPCGQCFSNGFYSFRQWAMVDRIAARELPLLASRAMIDILLMDIFSCLGPVALEY